jgi:hypothetical protein
MVFMRTYLQKHSIFFAYIKEKKPLGGRNITKLGSMEL